MDRFKDEIATPRQDSPTIRKGRFLWRDPDSQEKFLSQLMTRVRNGYYNSDRVLQSVVDEIAPVFSDSMQSDGALY
ncbi:MAG: hypothetical protein GF350_16940 [Chitinivibrionales bacterium]|nr:hypothetical protein [Chitinivibrionales bacterium]